MELRELCQERKKYLEEYRRRYEEKVVSLVKECGLYGVDVIADGIRGVIKIERGYGDDFKPVFYPYTKSGAISKKHHFVYVCFSDYNTDEKNKTNLKKVFKLAD